MRTVGLDETEDGGRIITNLIYADDVTLLAERKDSLCKILGVLKSAWELS